LEEAFMYSPRLILSLAAATAMIAGCSGTENLSPAPTSNGKSQGSDTAVVTTGPKPTSPAPVVASFALSGTVVGHEPGADTTNVVPVPNAAVTLVKIAGVEGDTLVPSVTAASTTTDAQGKFRLENLPPAYYRVDVAAPAGSPFLDGSWGVGPARDVEVSVYIALRRKN
jgi:hypothetical protein